jgi:hypothetical protein
LTHSHLALAAKVWNPPFVSKSAWRSNLTASLSHHCRDRPIAAGHFHLRMLRCGPTNRTFVHLAAFLLAETSVCRLSELSPQVRQWPLLVGVSSNQPECIYAISSIMFVIKSRIPSTELAAQ